MCRTTTHWPLQVGRLRRSLARSSRLAVHASSPPLERLVAGTLYRLMLHNMCSMWSIIILLLSRLSLEQPLSLGGRARRSSRRFSRKGDAVTTTGAERRRLLMTLQLLQLLCCTAHRWSPLYVLGSWRCRQALLRAVL